MSRDDIKEIKQRMQGIEMVLGQLRIDQKTMLEEQTKNFTEGNNSIIELKKGINNINVKLDKDIIPGTSSVSMIITVINNIEKHLEKISEAIKKNKEILDNLEVDATSQDKTKTSNPTGLTINEKIIQEKIDNLSIALNNIFIKEDQIITKIDFTTQRLFGKIESIETSKVNSTTSSNLDLFSDLREIKRLQEDLVLTLNKEKFSGKLQEIWELEKQNSAIYNISTTKILNEIGKLPVANIPENNQIDLGPRLHKYLNDKFGTLIPTISAIQAEFVKQQKSLFDIENNTEYIRNIHQDPFDQTQTHKKLDKIESLVKTFNFKEIEMQISNIFRETTDQTDFSQRLATAIRIGIHDRLKRIEENLYNFIRSHQTDQNTFTANIIEQSRISETTYYIHIDDLSPDRLHFIQ